VREAVEVAQDMRMLVQADSTGVRYWKRQPVYPESRFLLADVVPACCSALRSGPPSLGRCAESLTGGCQRAVLALHPFGYTSAIVDNSIKYRCVSCSSVVSASLLAYIAVHVRQEAASKHSECLCTDRALCIHTAVSPTCQYGDHR
jgi:hypothetical protein